MKEKQLTIKLDIEDYKKLVNFCKVENDFSHQDFVENAIKHCLGKKILPKIKK
jgi:hypothetical protein